MWSESERRVSFTRPVIRNVLLVCFRLVECDVFENYSSSPLSLHLEPSRSASPWTPPGALHSAGPCYRSRLAGGSPRAASALLARGRLLPGGARRHGDPCVSPGQSRHTNQPCLTNSQWILLQKNTYNILLLFKNKKHFENEQF